MNLRGAPLALVFFTSFLALACQCGHPAPAGLGEVCGPDRGCDDGLTCSQGECVALVTPPDGGTGGGTGMSTGGGSTGSGGGGGGAAAGGNTGTGGGGQNCGPCNTPPSACHALAGQCVNGSCDYPFITGATCDDGNACTVADTCENGGCSGTPKLCDAPPASVCTSSTQLKAYDSNGACQQGLCVYNVQTVTCGAGGCNNGACLTDPCASITCNTPPNSCFEATGLCQNGVCSYPYKNGLGCNDNNTCTDSDACQSGVCVGAPKVCNSPPANSCENASTAKMWSSNGGCNAGQCSYTFGFVSCANGCSNGTCTGSGWVKMTSNLTVNLRTVWGSAANAVWAGGDTGTLAFYNGAQWQVRPAGTSMHIVQVQGSSADNVFAGTEGAELLHFDGTGWTTVVTNLSMTPRALFTLGPKDVLVYGTVTTNSTSYKVVRVRETGGVWTPTHVTWVARFGPGGSARMFADSVSSVYIPGANYWNGTTSTELGQDTYFTWGPATLWKFGPQLFGLGWQDASGFFYKYVSASDTWAPLAHGFSGALVDFHGTAANRIFLVGTISSSAGWAGHVLYYDGLGFTDLPMPANVGRLRGVHALPTGEVFAVGDDGLVIKGP